MPFDLPRAHAAFDIEKVTKKFYKEFATHKQEFLQYITGIDVVADSEWYASVMLNRLMFVYFIQRKGFLDGERDYLRQRLRRCQQEYGQDQFYSFYRYFLLRLFHEGLGTPQQERRADLAALLGTIPYLNGGLFAVHELESPERYGNSIHIPDQAFATIFAYFDRYQWHLDERPLRADNEINPDVLGYIFEKYINQKQMGAYYTKEDITEYISKNTVVPFIFDAASAKCGMAFNNAQGPTVWDLLPEDPDRYIYPAVRHGVDHPLPAAIALGLDVNAPKLRERRQEWNKPAPAEYALPTEIWREVVARRQRYQAIRAQLASGMVREINEFITLNLNIRQFAQDVVQHCAGPDLLWALWQALRTITILDPTGGSGAFIFAALNILEPLYAACVERMEGLVAEWGANGPKLHPNYHKQFTAVLAGVAAHPNRRYFILKSIILHNLYAVDIMAEAVEICKLRLFLKLAAQVTPDASHYNLGIEPLPDIDFNIRTGNTLVGYATYAEVKNAIAGGLDLENAMEKITVKAADLQQTFDKFRQLQTAGDGSIPAAHKQELQQRLRALKDELNRHLATEYGVNHGDAVAYDKWLTSHQPFHWFIEFYGILHHGGFDVIIGNPPYVEYKTVTNDYAIKGYATAACGNLYAFVMERCLVLMQKLGKFAMIVPHSAFCTDRMQPIMDATIAQSQNCWISTYDIRPAKLFMGVDQRLAIYIQDRIANTHGQTVSTRYNRWNEETRYFLFDNLQYVNVENLHFRNSIPKIHTLCEQILWHKIHKFNLLSILLLDNGKPLYFHNAPRYWIRAMTFMPYSWKEHGGEQISSHVKTLNVSGNKKANIVSSILNSSLFYWWFILLSNCRDLSSREVELFPIGVDQISDSIQTHLETLSCDLMVDLNKNKQRKETQYKTTGKVIYDEFYPKYSKPIIDEIDTVLAEHYGFTAEELDFIINYDIKYRMGRNSDTEDS